MKKILYAIAAMICLTAFPAGAEEFVLGGCNHKIAGSGHGSDNAGEIAAAMYIPAAKLKTLAGNEISRIDVGLASRINVRNLNVWVRKTLDGANLALATVERPVQGWNEVSFATPYTLGNETDGLYIGYNYENAGSSHPVSFMGDGKEYTSYLNIGPAGRWEDMSERGALSIEAIVTGNHLPQYDLALLTGAVYPDISSGDGCYTVSGMVSNLALKDIRGFEITVSQAGATAGKTHVACEVPHGANVAFSAPFNSGFTLDGEVTLTVTAIDGGADADDSNNSITARVSFPKNVVVEEFTTENCVNCPEAAKWFNAVLASDPTYRNRVVPVCHHAAFGNDWLTRECDTELLWLFDMDGQTFAPAAMFDRHAAFRKGLYRDRLEPIVALRSQSDFEDCIKAEMAEETHALVGLTVVGEKQNQDNSEIDVQVSVLTDDAFNLTDPVLVFYVLENEVKAKRQDGASGTYYHHHVIREDNGSNGEPLVVTANSFRKTFTVILDPAWNRDNLYFAAFIANHNPDNVADNVVENGAVLYLADIPAAVGGIKSEMPEELYRYDVNGTRRYAPFPGINIIVYTDGTTKKEIVNN